MKKTLIALSLLAVASVADAKLTANEEAYVKAVYAQQRAGCLLNAVDYKLDFDVRQHRINDFGNVITAPVCADFVYANFLKLRAEYTKSNPKLIAEWEKGIKKMVKEMDKKLKA